MVTTCGRVALESLRHLDDGVVEARFVNYHHHAEPLRARMRGWWDRTDLTGALLEAGVDPWSLMAPASAIITLRRRPDGAGPQQGARDGAAHTNEEER